MRPSLAAIRLILSSGLSASTLRVRNRPAERGKRNRLANRSRVHQNPPYQQKRQNSEYGDECHNIAGGGLLRHDRRLEHLDLWLATKEPTTQRKPLLGLGYGAKVHLVVAIRRTKPPRDSRLFEHIHLERMRKAADSVQLAQELSQDARQQIEKSQRLVEESRKLRAWKERHGRENRNNARSKPDGRAKA